MADTTPKKRASIVTLHQRCQRSSRDIAMTVGVSQSTVCRVIRQFKATGSFTSNRKGKCGRKRKTTPKGDAYLIRNSKINPRKTRSDLQKDLEYSRVKISASFVRRLVLAGRKARRLQRKQLLTEKMRKKRFSWAKNCKEWRAEYWKKVLFSDESHFLVQGQQCRHDW